MLEKVKVSKKDFTKYKSLINKKFFYDIKSLAKKLEGLRIVHVNSTAEGGGVAEILRTLVPLMRSVGLKTDWYVIPGDEKFFDKKFLHDSLQGAKKDLPDSFFRYYLSHLKKVSNDFKKIKADIWVMHDPQPAGLINFLPNLHPSICRFHIDTSEPNKKTFDFFLPILNAYDQVIFSMKDYVCKGIPENKINIFKPAIDPFSEKNKEITVAKAKEVLKSVGISPDKPLVSQVGRFDPWKDPVGAIKAYKIAKKKIPDLQFVFIGFFIAKDDPGARRTYDQVKRIASGKDIFLLTDPSMLKGISVDLFVNAVQTISDVVLQKSIKEGFGLTVTEAMWKEKVVIGGDVGGIKIQIKNGENGFLVKTSNEAGDKIIKTIQNRKISERMGKKAKESVRRNFLMSRLLHDDLSLFKKML